MIEGSPGLASRYTPAVPPIPAGKWTARDRTDNIGGCALLRVFPGRGADGGMVLAPVPVRQTRQIVIRTPGPGAIGITVSGRMFFGAIVFRHPAARGRFMAVPEPLGLIYSRCKAAINGQVTLPR